MKTPVSILDHLGACADVCEGDFPGTIRKRWFEGAHGRSATQELIIQGDDGHVYRITAERLAPEDTALMTAGAIR